MVWVKKVNTHDGQDQVRYKIKYCILDRHSSVLNFNYFVIAAHCQSFQAVPLTKNNLMEKKERKKEKKK